MGKMSVYSLRKIKDLDGMHSGNYVLIRGRIINLYYDAVYQRAYLTVADDSGMILAKVQNAASQTIFTGAVVSVRGELAVHEGKIYLKTKEISKMQTVEDEYSNLVNITLIEESELPDFEGKKWVKPSSWNNKKIVTLRRPLPNRTSHAAYCRCFYVNRWSFANISRHHQQRNGYQSV